MAELHVGQGQAYTSLAKAAAAVKPGDTVIVHGGTYGRLSADVAGVTWRAAERETPILDGKWNPSDATKGKPAVVSITAEGVTLEGLRVVNAPGDAIVVGKGGHGATIRNCVTDVAYSGGIICNAGQELRGVMIDGCTVTRSGGGWVARGRAGGVSGAINLIRCTGATVVNTTSAYNWGEGLNVGKGSKGCTVRGCVIFDNAHFCLGVNHAQGVLIENNLLFLTGFERYQVGGENWPTGLTIGDEIGYGGDAFPPSREVDVRGNVIVNCGSCIGVRNGAGWDGYDTQLVDSVIERNTLIAGPCTRVVVNIGENGRGRPHKNSVVRANVIETSGATWPGFVPASGDTVNVAWEGNAWSVAPGAGFRSGNDVIGFELTNPAAALGNEFPAPAHNVNLDNYRPAAGGPVALGGIGALGPDGPNPPEEPPPDPEPGPEPDWLALIEMVDVIDLRLSEVRFLCDTAMIEVTAIREWIAAQGGEGPQ